MIEDARQVWKEKLDFLLTEEAKCADPAQKFKIRQDIKEAQAKLEELSLPKPPGGAADSPDQNTEHKRSVNTRADPSPPQMRERDAFGEAWALVKRWLDRLKLNGWRRVQQVVQCGLQKVKDRVGLRNLRVAGIKLIVLVVLTMIPLGLEDTPTSDLLRGWAMLGQFQNDKWQDAIFDFHADPKSMLPSSGVRSTVLSDSGVTVRGNTLKKKGRIPPPLCTLQKDSVVLIKAIEATGDNRYEANIEFSKEECL